MKLIELSKTSKRDKGKYFAEVDDADYDWLNQWNWTADKNGNTIYAHRMERIGVNKRKKIKMHRLIMGVTDSKILVDHKDRRGWNCQRHNLRICTKSENCKNKRPQGMCKYIGVGRWTKLYKNSKPFHAKIKMNGKQTYLGSFFTEEEAARKYDEFARIHHGEFANLNFP